MDMAGPSGYRGTQNGYGEYCGPCLQFREHVKGYTPGTRFDNPAFMHHHAMVHASLAETEGNIDISLKSCFPNSFPNRANEQLCPPNYFDRLQTATKNSSGEYCAQCLYFRRHVKEFTPGRWLDNPAAMLQHAKMHAFLAKANDNVDVSLRSCFPNNFTNIANQMCRPNGFDHLQTVGTVNSSDERQTGRNQIQIKLEGLERKQTSGLHSVDVKDTNSSPNKSWNYPTPDFPNTSSSMNNSISNNNISSILSRKPRIESSNICAASCSQLPVSLSIVTAENSSSSNSIPNLGVTENLSRMSQSPYGRQLRRKRKLETVGLEYGDDNEAEESEFRRTSWSVIDKSTLDVTSDDKKKIRNRRSRQSWKKVLDKAVSAKLTKKIENGEEIKCRSCGWSIQAGTSNSFRAICNHIFKAHVHLKKRRYKCLTCDLSFSFNTSIKHRSHSVLDLAVISREKISEFVENNFVYSSNANEDVKPSPNLRLPNIEELVQNEDITGNTTGSINEKVRTALGLTSPVDKNQKLKLGWSILLEQTVATKLNQKVKKGENIMCRSCGWSYRGNGRRLSDYVTGITRHIFMVHVHGQKRRHKCLTCNAYLNTVTQISNHRNRNHPLIDLAKIHKHQISLFVDNNFVESSNDDNSPSPDLILPDVKDHLPNEEITGNTERPEFTTADKIRKPKLRSTKILDPAISIKLRDKLKKGNKIKCRSCGWSYQAKGVSGMNNYLKCVCAHIFKSHLRGQKKQRYKCLTCDLKFNCARKRVEHKNHDVLDLFLIHRNKISEFIGNNFVESANEDDTTPSQDLILPNIDE